jgi:hypothetical protein
LGACSQEAEGRAGTANSPDSVIREETSCTRHLSLPSLLLSYGSQCRQRAAMHKNLSFAQKLLAYDPPSGVTRTSIGGLQSRSGRTGPGKRGLQTRSFVWQTSCTRNLSLVTLASILLYKHLPFAQKLPAYAPPTGATRTSIGGLQLRSGMTGRESEFSRLGHS